MKIGRKIFAIKNKCLYIYLYKNRTLTQANDQPRYLRRIKRHDKIYKEYPINLFYNMPKPRHINQIYFVLVTNSNKHRGTQNKRKHVLPAKIVQRL